MKKSGIKIISILGVLVVLIAFAIQYLISSLYHTSEVPKGDKLWGGYEADREYVLLRDVFLMPGYGGMAKERLALVPEGSFGRKGGRHQVGPDTIAAYEADPDKAVIEVYSGGEIYKMDVIGIVRKGTRLRMVRLDHHKGWSPLYGRVQQLTLWAEILDGEYAGKKVDIEDISESEQATNEDVYMHLPEAGLIAPIAPVAGSSETTPDTKND